MLTIIIGLFVVVFIAIYGVLFPLSEHEHKKAMKKKK